MARVLGVGGVFFKAKDPGALEDWGGTFIQTALGHILDPDGTKIELWQPKASAGVV